ncbi:MAG: hypothetical protein ABFR36_04190 [Acidobacteriota bacterium]
MKKYLNFILIIFLIGSSSSGWSQEEKSPEKKKVSKILKRSARIISGLKISSVGKPSFSKQKQKAIRHLRRVVKFSNSKAQKNYLGAFIKCLKDEKFEDFPKTEFISGTDFDLLIKYDKTNSSFSAIALKTLIEENKNSGKLFDQIRVETGKGILGRNVRFFPGSNVIKISEVLYPEDMKKEKMVLNSASEDSQMYPGVILLKNKIEKDFEDKIKPLSLQIFKKKISAGMNAGMLLRNIFLHHVAHYTIPFSIKAEEEKRDFTGAGLKELFYDAEEIRADLNYLTLISLLDEKELLKEGLKEEVLYLFILQKLAKMIGEEGLRENYPSTTIINSLYRGGGIATDKGGKKLVVNIDVLVRNIKTLETSFEDIFKNGNHIECKTFFNKNSEIPENLKKLLKISVPKTTE